MRSASTLAFLLAIVVASIGITVWVARRNRTTTAFYVAENGVGGWQNGLAIAGDYLSAASFLGIVGATAITGLSGFYLGIGTPTTFLLIALIIAEPLRNLGRFTLGDMLTCRFESKTLRALAALNTIIVSGFYMIAQFVGAGLLVSLLFGVDYAASLVIVAVLMAIYVLVGGMLAITWIQSLKTVLLIAAAAVLLALTMAQFGWSPAAIFERALQRVGPGLVAPPHPPSLAGRLDYISYGIGLALGPIGLPHVLIRFLTVPNAAAARKSIVVATWLISLFITAVAFIGLGAAAILGKEQIIAANPAGTLTTPLLATALGGPLLLGFVAAVIFATTLAVMAGIAIAAAGAFAHDLYANVINRDASDRQRLAVARMAAVAVSVLALVAAYYARTLNLAVVGVMGMSIAASTNLPVILLTLFWRRFNLTGAITAIGVGLAASLLLVAVSPTVMGTGALFPLLNIGLVSIPIGFAAAWLGTLAGGRQPAQSAVYDQVTVRANLTA